MTHESVGGAPQRGGAGVPPTADRPVHLRPRSFGLVALGGTAGTATREALVLAFPVAGAFPGAILAINVTGAFLLGLLLERLVQGGPDTGGRRDLRLLFGTGFLGGYTTYSALANDTARLLLEGPVALGVVNGLGTVLVGAVASWAGIAIGARLHRHDRAEAGR